MSSWYNVSVIDIYLNAFTNEQTAYQYWLPTLESVPQVTFSREQFELGDDSKNELLTVLDQTLGLPAKKYSGPHTGLNPEWGLDCSGYILFVLSQLSFYNRLIVPLSIRHASEMFDHLGICVNEHFRLPGDLVFFTRKGMSVSHVGFYRGLGNDGKPYLIHSPGVYGRTVELRTFYKRTLPILYDTQIYAENIVGYKRLSYHSISNY